MLASLQNHPFAVEAFFEQSLVLTFAIPKEQLLPFLPTRLSLDTFEDQWGFIAIAMVQTKALRPKGFPAFLGQNFFLAGYRIFVRYQTQAGKHLRGLFILQSQTNKWRMQYLGNLFTHYQYSTIDIQQSKSAEQQRVWSNKANFDISIQTPNPAAELPLLPSNSPFPDWKKARRFAGPLPFTFSYDPNKDAMTIVEGVRSNWTPQPVAVEEYQVNFLKEKGIEGGVLASAFVVEQIPYYWKKGRLETWK